MVTIGGLNLTTANYGLDLSYSPTALAALGNGSTSTSGVYVAYLNGTTWTDISTGAEYGFYTDGLAVGSWGINTSNDTIWVVTDHTAGSFAVVPEPGTLALLAAALLSLIAYAWRKRKN